MLCLVTWDIEIWDINECCVDVLHGISSPDDESTANTQISFDNMKEIEMYFTSFDDV